MPSDRATTVRTPLGGDTLTFTHLAGRDEVSRCLSFTVGFVSTDLDIDPLKMLGQPVSVQGEAKPERWFSGLVSDFRMTKVESRLAYYEATLRPWLWFLGNSTDCRIFQHKSVIEIVEDVFSEYGIAKFEKRLQGSYPQREYCVQYDESDLEFVQRLLEHEGIFYFFEYGDDEHTLVLVDAMNKLQPVPDYEEIAFNPDFAVRPDAEYITSWMPGRSVRSAAYVHTDYDFTKPGVDLAAKSSYAFSHGQADGEQYHQPGAHLDTGRGDKIAAIRREELQATHERVTARANARGLHAGCTFKLVEFPRDDQNQEYLVVGADYRLHDPGYTTGVDAGGDTFQVLLELAPTSLPYRPPRLTRRPIMRGPQTATVVGPSGQEIYTDKYARVKVQFHWDRLGKKDQDSSCFVRVSQVWAGSGWGFIQIPRIGQEVVVDFIEGDPDQPIITGRVYNAAQMPPYALPGNATQSGVKSNSSLGGGGWNEFRFEDLAGKEEVYFQAQKDHNLLIKHDRGKLVQHDQSDRIDNDAKHSVGHDLAEDVGHDKTLSVGHDRTGNIGNNDTETVGANRSLTVGANETIHVVANATENIDANHSQTVGLSQTITVALARTDTVGAAEIRTVGAAQTNTIGAMRAVSVGINQSHDIGAADSWNVGASQSVTIGASQSVTVGADQTLNVGSKRTTSIGADDTTSVSGARALSVAKDSSTGIDGDSNIKIGKKLTIDVAESITLTCGSASITMKKDGTISIEGKDISINGSGKISVKASSDVIIKGSTINAN
ncbi:type VI secretion system tip protein VgrG [Mesorhizobium sp. BR1-1-16]|uniref:type VI secretion system Vgr family protein n=1 Tax=Mesorhizobium sp. BR1-1-16 TaxID=2876653 RepID=UPI001CCD4446|nr:type VI secretion system tip protein TssI/VgrG [Mesorhizobium sp. BR1-1-16]MBZ9936330.1 type VI secretion system tip protein VgrG [Mesorhizobium sp. BR1-1-16]